MTRLIARLKARGLITDVLGSLPRCDINPAFVVWARSKPKSAFRAFCLLSRALSQKPLTVFVDDVCSRLVAHRTTEEQEGFNELYKRFFVKHGCVVKFSSELHNQEFACGLFPTLVELGKKVPVGEFVRCLPETKRQNLNQLGAEEILHALLELYLLERVQQSNNLLLVGHFSQAIVISHRRIAKHPLPAIALPTLNGEEGVAAYQQLLAETQDSFL